MRTMAEVWLQGESDKNQRRKRSPTACFMTAPPTSEMALGQRDILGANLDAVLRVAAFLNAAVAHQRRETLALQLFACGMRVEQPHLRDGGRAHEAGLFVELRAGLHAAAAGDAAGKRISRFLLFRRHARAGAEVVGAIDRNPGLDDFQILEEHAAIDSQIADDGKFGERLELNRLLEIVDQAPSRPCGRVR